jgi:hypothetical protein
MINCAECSSAIYDPATKSWECGLNAERAFLCPNVSDDDETSTRADDDQDVSQNYE